MNNIHRTIAEGQLDLIYAEDLGRADKLEVIATASLAQVHATLAVADEIRALRESQGWPTSDTPPATELEGLYQSLVEGTGQ